MEKSEKREECKQRTENEKRMREGERRGRGELKSQPSQQSTRFLSMRTQVQPPKPQEPHRRLDAEGSTCKPSTGEGRQMTLEAHFPASLTGLFGELQAGQGPCLKSKVRWGPRNGSRFTNRYCSCRGPSTHDGCLRTTCNSSSRRSITLF